MHHFKHWLFLTFLLLCCLCIFLPGGASTSYAKTSTNLYIKNKDFYVYDIDGNADIRFMTVADSLDTIIDDRNWIGGGSIYYDWISESAILVHMVDVNCKNYTPWIYISISNRVGYHFDSSSFGPWTGTGCAGTSAHYTGAPYIMDTTVQQYIGAQFGYESITFYQSPNTYTIYYNGNGNTSGDTPAQSASYDQDISLHTNGYQKTCTLSFNSNGGTGTSSKSANAAFLGWSFQGQTYGPNRSVRNLTADQNGSVTMNAIWGSAYTTLPSVSRTGYLFAGWYDSSGTFVGNAGAGYNFTESKTLTAHWTPITYTITYHSNGIGNVESTKQTLTYDQWNRVKTCMFSQAGFVFQKWNTQADGNGVTYLANASIFNLRNTQNANVDLYAIWDTDFTLLLQGDGGSTATGNTVVSISHVNNDTLFPDYPFYMSQEIDGQIHHFSQQGWDLFAGSYYYDDTVYYAKDSIHKYHTSATAFLLNVMKHDPSSISTDSSGAVAVTMYAVWDEAPQIFAEDVYLTSQELLDLGEEGLRNFLLDENQVSSTDREDDYGSISIYDMDFSYLTQLVADMSSTRSYGGTSITYAATDMVDNQSFHTIQIFLTSTTENRSLDGSGDISPVYVRFIDEAHLTATSSQGGLDPNSKWILNDALQEELKDAVTDPLLQ